MNSLGVFVFFTSAIARLLGERHLVGGKEDVVVGVRERERRAHSKVFVRFPFGKNRILHLRFQSPTGPKFYFCECDYMFSISYARNANRIKKLYKGAIYKDRVIGASVSNITITKRQQRRGRKKKFRGKVSAMATALDCCCCSTMSRPNRSAVCTARC